MVDTVGTREQRSKLFPSRKQASCNYYEKTENRIETAVFKKPKPKTEPIRKKTDQKTENRNRPKKPKPTQH